jgi:hypothetical protein
MGRVLAQVLLFAPAGSTVAVSAQTAARGTPKARKAPNVLPAPSIASQLKTMSEAVEVQQKQIEELRQELQSRNPRMAPSGPSIRRITSLSRIWDGGRRS